MPRPPVLPTIDWKHVLETAKTFDAWLQAGENSENRNTIQAAIESQTLPPSVEAHLAALPRDVYVLAFAEDWCGDVVRHVPVLERMARCSSRIHTRYLFREENKELFARYLTNGGEAIPKFIFLSDQYVECGNWGPMPQPCKDLIARGKAVGDVAAARKKVALLYEADADKRGVVNELLALFDTAAALTV